MKPILVLYATREGHTRRIAEAIAKTIEARGECAQLMNAAQEPENFSLRGYGAVLLAASVHAGKHEREVVNFAECHRSALERLPNAFISVSLSEAGAEEAERSPADRDESARKVQRLIEDFEEETAWNPERVNPVAGALPYTQYNFLMRFVMKQIVKHQGGSTDTSRDHDYTDWHALERFVIAFLDETKARRVQDGASSAAQAAR